MDSTITHFLDGWDKHDMVCSMGGKTESTHGLGLDGVQTFVRQLNRRVTLIYHGGWLSYPHWSSDSDSDVDGAKVTRVLVCYYECDVT